MIGIGQALTFRVAGDVRGYSDPETFLGDFSNDLQAKGYTVTGLAIVADASSAWNNAVGSGAFGPYALRVTVTTGAAFESAASVGADVAESARGVSGAAVRSIELQAGQTVVTADPAVSGGWLDSVTGALGSVRGSLTALVLLIAGLVLALILVVGPNVHASAVL